MQLRPSFQSRSAIDQIAIARWQLPRAIDPSAGIGADICHRLDVFRGSLEVIQRRRGLDGIAKRRVSRHIGDDGAIDEDLPSVAEAFEVTRSILDQCYFLGLSF